MKIVYLVIVDCIEKDKQTRRRFCLQNWRKISRPAQYEFTHGVLNASGKTEPWFLSILPPDRLHTCYHRCFCGRLSSTKGSSTQWVLSKAVKAPNSRNSSSELWGSVCETCFRKVWFHCQFHLLKYYPSVAIELAAASCGSLALSLWHQMVVILSLNYALLIANSECRNP